jgi:serine/threonine protein kinase
MVSGKNVAVKILEKEKSKIFKYESLKYEANILNLNHENIVKIFKIIDSKKFGAIIMEILDGYSLTHIIDSCKINLIHRLRWVKVYSFFVSILFQNRYVTKSKNCFGFMKVDQILKVWSLLTTKIYISPK